MHLSTRLCSPLRTIILLVSVAIGLSGCATSSKDTETRFYLLSTLPPATAPVLDKPTTRPLSVALMPVQLPQYLQRPQIVSRIAVNQLALAEFDNWGGNLGKNISRVMAANLSHLLNTPEVLVTGLRQAAQFDARIEIQILKFERGPDNRATLKAQWRIFGPGTEASPRPTRISSFSSDPIPVPVTASVLSRRADVAAMSRLLGDLSTTIAQAIAANAGS